MAVLCCESPSLALADRKASSHALHVSSRRKMRAPERAAQRHRPKEHFQPATGGWMNDTIGPLYIASTGLYHLFCQWNPHGTEWGNMSWYSAVSTDLVQWTPYGQQPALKPDQACDREGVFTGCIVPHGPKGEENMMTAIYTAASSPNIHWSLPYERGSESVSIATSVDGGRSWRKYASNPFLPGPPRDQDVVGFRDPVIMHLPTLDRLLGRETSRSLYATLSGGLFEQTPTPFLYSVNTDNLEEWESLGPLMQLGLDFRPDTKWSGECGRNFECCSLFELKGTPTLVTGTEGGARRWSMWIQGELELQHGRPHLSYRQSGVLDWGSYYAASTTEHPIDGRRFVLGWILEDDITAAQRKSQGWAGMASLPREVVQLEYYNITGALATPVCNIGSMQCTEQAGGAYTVKTLGIRPCAELLKVRASAKAQRVEQHRLGGRQRWIRLPVESTTWELDLEAALSKECTVFSIRIEHTGTEYTVISFDLRQETMTVDRTHSTSLPDVKVHEEHGPHTLFTLLDPETGSITQETLRMRVFFDASVIEVYANDRFALSTRVYPCYSADTASGCVTIEANGYSEEIRPEDAAVLLHCSLWQR